MLFLLVNIHTCLSFCLRSSLWCLPLVPLHLVLVLHRPILQKWKGPCLCSQKTEEKPWHCLSCECLNKVRKRVYFSVPCRINCMARVQLSPLIAEVSKNEIFSLFEYSTPSSNGTLKRTFSKRSHENKYLSVLVQIRLIAYQKYLCILVCVSEILEPSGNCFKGIPLGDIIHQNSSLGPPVILTCNRIETFLAS